MKIILLVYLISQIVFITAFDCSSCVKPNEEYTKCGLVGKTCENQIRNKVCDQTCNEGCFCKQGFLRDYNGDCVAFADCIGKWRI